jgi:dTDP-glucose 4,6-dehydratase
VGSAFVRYLFRQPDFTGTVVNLDLLTYAGNPENLQGAVDASRYQFVRGDIGDGPLVERLCDEHGVDLIVNFAAESHVDRSIHGPGAFVQTNVLGTYHLLEVLRRRPGIHLHHISTDEVFGSLGETGYFVEDTPYAPSSPYAASKACSDHLVRAYARTYGLSTTVSNCSNNYGPCQFPEKLIPLMILNAMARKPLPVYGKGQNVRDWLFVDDHAEAVWRIVRHGAAGSTYNVGGRNEWKNLDLVHTLCDLLAQVRGEPADRYRSLITFVTDRPGHDLRYAIDCTRIERELGWVPAHDFQAGLRATVEWYLANPTWVERVQSGAYREWIEKNYGGR